MPATVSFVDIAGIVRGASEGEGLGNKFLANIREADAICQVIRAFTDDDVVHVDGKVSPRDDIETINTELILADLQTLEKAMPRLEKEVKGKKAEKSLLATPLPPRRSCEAGDTLFAAGAAAGVDLDAIRELPLLTTKPFLYVFNLRRGRADRRRAQGRAARAGRAGRGDLPRRQDRVRARRAASPRRRPSCWSRSASRSRASTSWPGSASPRSACRPT